jgi:hypothetical protein
MSTSTRLPVIAGIILGAVWFIFWGTLCIYIAGIIYKAIFIRPKSVGKWSVYFMGTVVFLLAGCITTFWFRLVFWIFPIQYSWECSALISAVTTIFFIWCMHRIEIAKKPLWLPWPLKPLLIKFLDEVYQRKYYGIT